MNFSDRALNTRAQLQQVVRDLFQPLRSHFSIGGARVKLGETGAIFPLAGAELEGFSRPLWGLVSLVAGGGSFDDWELYRKGLTNGADPNHPEFWGRDHGYAMQFHVEMAAIGFALAVIPEHVWTPLSAEAKQNLASWLGQIYQANLGLNNWQFFRVLVHLGLTRVGAQQDSAPVEASLKELDSYYLGDGWYSDGKNRACDYYIPFAMHFYGLMYARLAGDIDPERATRFRERATLFARDFMHWFAADGAAIPFGRSMTYRFAQGCFWGALAYADVEALPWGMIKGLALRHLRWWFRPPIFNDDGILTIGYAYPNLNMAEPYNSPGSPYWAMKFFLPLALPESHPFWTAEEEPLPKLDRVTVQKPPGLIICRDDSAKHVYALAGAQPTAWLHGQNWMRHAPAKYSKFAYSTLFGFSVPVGDIGLAFGAQDSMLALSEEGDYWRARTENIEQEIIGAILHMRWAPWPDVEVETWLIPSPPWHIRVHKLKTNRKLFAAENGFAASCMDDVLQVDGRLDTGVGFARSVAPPHASGIRDLMQKRAGEINYVLPNTNLLYPKSLIPMLKSEHVPGEDWLICAVLGTSTVAEFESNWNQAPQVRKDGDGFTVADSVTNAALFHSA